MRSSTTVFVLLSFALATATPTTPATAPFSLKLFGEISKSNGNGNVIVSPASIRTCLGLAYMGADGETANELYNTLQLQGKTKDEVGEEFRTHMQKVENSGVEMKTANRIYVSKRYDLSPEYIELTKKYFKAQPESVDFRDPAVPGKINAWVDEQTNQKIKQIIAPGSLDDSASAILVNAIYFKATWQYKFQETDTEDKNFHVSQDKAVPVKMMHQSVKLQYAEIPEFDATAVEIPYSNTDIRMMVLLPNKMDGLAAMEQKMTNADLKNVNFWSSKVNLQLPKFKIEFKISLNDVLSKLGIKNMFTNGDFSSLTTKMAAFNVSDVNHKAFIEVDEKGTEAAAATAVLMTRTNPGPREMSHDFIVDHPFFFAIRDDDTIYFAGHITNF